MAQTGHHYHPEVAAIEKAREADRMKLELVGDPWSEYAVAGNAAVEQHHDRTNDPNMHPSSYTNPRWTVQKTVIATATTHTVTTTKGCYLIEGDAKPINGKICVEYGNSRWGILKKYHGTVLKKVYLSCTLMSVLSAALYIQYKGLDVQTPPFSLAHAMSCLHKTCRAQ